jgi:3-deoxy-manno-octulosonate cytidylyltransferase (CMP-KDO synthetase)
MEAPRGGAHGRRDLPRALALVPARLESQRLPRKMLLAETGRPLVLHTLENTLGSGVFQRAAVATDSPEIQGLVVRAGFEAVLTRADHESGTSRAAEAARLLGAQGFDVLVNVQGDEPELERGDLEHLVAAFRDPSVEAATLAGPLAEADLERAGVVKVVCDAAGDALYFSRAPIPWRPGKDAGAYPRADARPWGECARRHVGVYAFRPAALERFVALPRGRLEALENLEQLRWLEAGRRMRVVEARHVPLGIDTRADYDAFVLRSRGPAAHRPRPQ